MEYFYARLFAENPRLRELFPATMEVQRSRLLRALVRVVQGADDPTTLDGFLRQLGHDHRKFDVRPDHYEAFGRALVATLREHSRGAWTPAVEHAWAGAYAMVAEKMLAGAATADGTPARWAAEVIGHERLGGDLALLTVQPDRPYPFRPGQYASVQTARRPRLWRSYSIANPPRPDGALSFHVRSIPGGWVSNALVAHTGRGDILRLGPPLGTLRIDPESTRDLLFVAGGTGLAPISAMVGDLARWNRDRTAHLFLGARRTEDFYQLAELCRLADRQPWLTVVAAASHDPGYLGRRGMIADVVANHGSWVDHEIVLSGPPAMIRATVGRLRAQRVDPTDIQFDPLADEG